LVIFRELSLVCAAYVSTWILQVPHMMQVIVVVLNVTVIVVVLNVTVIQIGIAVKTIVIHVLILHIGRIL
jgi:hypothetical protein